MKGDVHIFHISGKPISKKRPRFVTRKTSEGKIFSRAVNIQQTEEGRFLFEVLRQWDDKQPIVGAIAVTMACSFARPKSHYGTGRNSGVLKPQSPIFCLNSNDLDNIEKFILDSLNSYIYGDDRQVVDLHAVKMWSGIGYPLVAMTIKELE